MAEEGAGRIENGGEEEVKYWQPNTATFPRARPVEPPQLKVESEDSEQSDYGLWQVYAFGGYIVLKWLWGKWKERQNQKGNANGNG